MYAERWKGFTTMTDRSVEHVGFIQIGIKFLNVPYIYYRSDTLAHAEIESNKISPFGESLTRRR